MTEGFPKNTFEHEALAQFREELLESQKSETKKVEFSEEEFESFFSSPYHDESSFWDEYSAEPRDTFLESKYYSEEGLLWAMELIQKKQRQEEENQQSLEEFYPVEGSAEEDDSDIIEKPEFYEWDETGEIMDSEFKDLYDMGLYFQRQQVIRWLGKVGTHKSIDYLTEFLQRDTKSHVYLTELPQVFSAIDPQYAGGKLLELLRNIGPESTWPHGRYRFDLGRMLYRLELGRLHISEHVVKYLDHEYELADVEGNPVIASFVKRLTPAGEMGVFDQDEKLRGVFELGDLSDESPHTAALVRDLSYEMLFTPRTDETPEQREERVRILAEFQEEYFRFYKDSFFEQTGVQANNLSLKEQGWFLQFMRNADDETYLRAMDFVRSYGENGLRTFLSLDYGQEIGGKILEFGDQCIINKEEQKANVIFRLFGTIIDQSEGVMQEIQKTTVSPDERPEAELIGRFSEQISEAVLRRTKDLLLASWQIVQETNSHNESLDDVIRALQGVSTFFDALQAITLPQSTHTVCETINGKQQDGITSFEIRNKKTSHEYRMRIFVRPYEEQINIGKDETRAAQARVNFELDFSTGNPDKALKKAFSQSIRYMNRGNSKEMSRLRIALDRDTYTNPPLVSLDMGRDRRTTTTFERSGDVLGRLLSRVSESGHHNPYSFDPDLADAQKFGAIAGAFKSFLESKVPHQPQSIPRRRS